MTFDFARFWRDAMARVPPYGLQMAALATAAIAAGASISAAISTAPVKAAAPPAPESIAERCPGQVWPHYPSACLRGGDAGRPVREISLDRDAPRTVYAWPHDTPVLAPPPRSVEHNPKANRRITVRRGRAGAQTISEFDVPTEAYAYGLGRGHHRRHRRHWR